MPLTSIRFAGDERLERCLTGDFSARLTPGTRGDFVAAVQQALIDLGESLPAAGADGVYGDETVQAVLSYKTRRGIATPEGLIDGIVGRGTLGSLDAECTARDEQFGPCPPDPNGPQVTLDGTDELLVNYLFATTTAASVVGVDGDGMTRLVPGGVQISDQLALLLTESAAAALGPDRPLGGASDLLAALSQLAAAHTAVGDVAQAQALADHGSYLNDIDAAAQLQAILTQGLAAITPHASTPVRDLTKHAALFEALSHAAAGRVTLTPGSTTNPDGSIQMPDERGRFAIGAQVAGVTFKFTPGADKRLPSYAPATSPMAMLDVRNVVGIVRLALFLSSEFGVTEVHHAGISGDNDRTDCHGGGRAVDFVGVVGRAADVPYHLTVLNDWASRTVPNLADRTRPRRPDWPSGSGRLEYRLDSLPGVDGFARNFFSRLYQWVGSEYQDRTEGPGQTAAQSAIGENTRIMNPDHPDSAPLPAKNGREAHRGHVHWQVGPTGFQAP